MAISSSGELTSPDATLPELRIDASDKEESFISVSTNAKASFLAITSGDREKSPQHVYIFSNNRKFEQLARLEIGKAVQCLKITPWGDDLAIGCGDGTIEIWNVKEKEKVQTLPKVHREAVSDIAFDGSGEIMVSSSLDSTNGIYKTANPRFVRKLLEKRAVNWK